MKKKSKSATQVSNKGNNLESATEDISKKGFKRSVTKSKEEFSSYKLKSSNQKSLKEVLSKKCKLSLDDISKKVKEETDFNN